MIIQSNNAPYIINSNQIHLISQRYHTVVESIKSSMNSVRSIYVGSYGRGTAINTSDIDILVELPAEEFNHYDELKGDSQSRLLSTIKEVINNHYSSSHVSADGQIVGIDFFDGPRFEILPVFKNVYGGYTYPNADNGGRWMFTDPKDEQIAMQKKNRESNGLLFDTCRTMRYIRDQYSSYKLKGIIIDSFVYQYIKGWHYLWSDEEADNSTESLENDLLNDFYSLGSEISVRTPGSNQFIKLGDSYEDLGKVLNRLNA